MGTTRRKKNASRNNTVGGQHEDFSGYFVYGDDGVDDRLRAHGAVSKSQRARSENSWSGNWRAKRRKVLSAWSSEKRSVLSRSLPQKDFISTSVSNLDRGGRLKVKRLADIR